MLFARLPGEFPLFTRRPVNKCLFTRQPGKYAFVISLIHPGAMYNKLYSPGAGSIASAFVYGDSDIAYQL